MLDTVKVYKTVFQPIIFTEQQLHTVCTISINVNPDLMGCDLGSDFEYGSKYSFRSGSRFKCGFESE